MAKDLQLPHGYRDARVLLTAVAFLGELLQGGQPDLASQSLSCRREHHGLGKVFLMVLGLWNSGRILDEARK